MEKYIVSARKYRPVTFKSVVGQETITGTLKNAIRNNQLAQAFLFCGPRGVGKTTCARILAKTINCFSLSQDTEPCNECESCESFNHNASFNIHELDAASNNSVDDIRSLIDQVRFAPQVGKYSIYIIDEVHMLSSSAFNAFLKTLEEPPAHAIFIMATTERHKILPTILSRCQVFTFNRIKVDDIASHLDYVAKSENITAESDALHVIAQKADGGLRDALSMFDQIVSYSGGNNVTYTQAIENLNVLDYDYYFRLTDFLWEGNYSEALLLFSNVLEKGFDGGNFIAGLAEHFRNLLVCQDAITLSLLEVSAGVKNKYQTQSQKCNPVQLIRALDQLSKTEQSLRGSKNQRLNIELALLQLSFINAPSEEKKNPEPAVKPIEKVTETLPSQTEIPEKKAVLNFRGNAPLRTVSINQHLKKNEKPKVEERPIIETHSIVEDAPQHHFEWDELKTVWNSYCEQIQKNGRMAMLGTLTLSEPTLHDNYLVKYEVHNDSQMRELELEKPDLIMYLRKQLKNYALDFTLEKSHAEKSFKPYTAEEKLKAMIERNPSVGLLRQKFGLQPD
jgi:DNA polymerase-3 subunit gamma/tau